MASLPKAQSRLGKAPNLDMHDKIIRRGMFVCWYGLRGIVNRVRVGRCLVTLPGETYGKWLPCSSVYVVPDPLPWQV